MRPILSFGMTIEASADDPVAQRRGIADRIHRRDHGEGLLERKAFPGECIGIDRRIQMEIDGHAAVGTHLEERGPVIVKEGRKLQAFRRIREYEALDPHIDASARFGFHRRFVPQGQMAKREQALAGFLLTFRGGIVVDFDHGHRKFVVPEGHQRPGLRDPRILIANLRIHAHVIHGLKARLRVMRALVAFVDGREG
jgi:hypothetical protein